MFTKEVFGTRLRQVRKSAGESQEDLAEILGVTATQVSDMEKGKKTTTLEKFALICQHYRAAPAYLLGLTDDP